MWPLVEHFGGNRVSLHMVRARRDSLLSANRWHERLDLAVSQ
jgi:hypothetical protein